MIKIIELSYCHALIDLEKDLEYYFYLLRK